MLLKRNMFFAGAMLFEISIFCWHPQNTQHGASKIEISLNRSSCNPTYKVPHVSHVSFQVVSNRDSSQKWCTLFHPLDGYFADVLCSGQPVFWANHFSIIKSQYWMEILGCSMLVSGMQGPLMLF